MYTKSTLSKHWVETHCDLTFEKWPDILEYGLFIVNSTFATSNATLNVMYRSDRKLTAGSKARLRGMDALNNSATWLTAQKDSGLVQTTGEDVCTKFCNLSAVHT